MKLGYLALYGFVALGILACVLAAKTCVHPAPATLDNGNGLIATPTPFRQSAPPKPVATRSNVNPEPLPAAPDPIQPVLADLVQAKAQLSHLLEQPFVRQANQDEIDQAFEDLLLAFRTHISQHNTYSARCTLEKLMNCAPQASPVMVRALHNDLCAYEAGAR